MKNALKDDVVHVLLCAADMARTSRGGLSDSCIATLGWDFYWPCRRVLEFLETQLGYEIWTAWGDEVDPRRPDAMTYADALLEAAELATDHWQKVVDSIRMESDAIRVLRAEVRELRDMLEDRGIPDPFKDLYHGIFK